ncbi:hypothetical protein DPMN_086803 [Dreissena polymorpha]|uniref:Uncharacterized protein n=1 Tax=Dreissena polymorpha TaxID=45954 RepID=A0A9D4QV12_DREPO|nr:hypothetical protein DPMN_086803 [Dreissena polymorpha]
MTLVLDNVWGARPGFSTTTFKPDLAVDLFGIGTDVYNSWRESRDVNTVSTKIDAVLDSITNLKQTVSDLFAQQAFQVRLAGVERFHRQTLNRIRELSDIVNAKNTEKDKYMQLFIVGTKSSYLDALYNFIPNLIEKTISSDETLLELIRDH